jgi:hypothetical protein
MNAGLDHHYPEETWENYALGHLSDRESETLEEHLLICSVCQDLLAQTEEYIEVAKAALRLSAASDPSTRNRRRQSKSVAAAATLR